MISSPGCAGRQCSAIAPGAARSSSASSSRYGASASRRAPPRPRRRPSTPTRRCRARRRRPPPPPDRRSAPRPCASGAGSRAAPPPHLDARERPDDRQRARDVVAVADVGQHAALQVAERLAHRQQVGERLARVVVGRACSRPGPRRARRARAAAALAVVRSPIAPRGGRTRAVSRIDSPRVSWSSFARSTIGWPPSSCTPASNEVRVRVEGCSNSSATVRPSSRREARAALQRPRGRAARSARGGQLLAGEEVARQGRYYEPQTRSRAASAARARPSSPAAAARRAAPRRRRGRRTRGSAAAARRAARSRGRRGRSRSGWSPRARRPRAGAWPAPSRRGGVGPVGRAARPCAACARPGRPPTAARRARRSPAPSSGSGVSGSS